MVPLWRVVSGHSTVVAKNSVEVVADWPFAARSLGVPKCCWMIRCLGQLLAGLDQGPYQAAAPLLWLVGLRLMVWCKICLDQSK